MKEMKFDQKELEKLMRKNAFYGVANFLVWCVCFVLASNFLDGVAKVLEINELWTLVVLFPAGVWFLKFMEDK